VCLLLASCASGTETGNPDDTLRIGIGALPDARPTDLSLETAEISIRSVTLSPCTGDEGHPAGAVAVDLLAGRGADLDVVHDAPDACGATVELGPYEGSTPAELVGLTLRFSGTRGDGVPFQVSSVLAHHVTLVPATPDMPLDVARLVVAFDLGVWLDAASIPSLSPVDGAVLVDEGHNPDAHAAFDAAIVHALALYLDANGNGVLDPGERTPVAVVP
jgi:hypothetical protein